jgi:DNA-binding response OmpR family regulator
MVPTGRLIDETGMSLILSNLKELLTNLIPSVIQRGRPTFERGKARILVVDDEAINQKIVGSIIKAKGFEEEIAPYGIIALMQNSNEKFDLILSVIARPNLDGIKMLEFMKHSDINISVVFLTSDAGAENEAKGLSFGAVDYITKPIDPELTLLRIEKILKHYS